MTIVTTAEEQSKLINELSRQEKWEEIRALILQWLEDEPNEHGLLAELSKTYYEERKYDIALDYIKQAKKIAPHCPVVLWYYAGTLDMLKRNEDAIQLYKNLIRRGIDKIAYGECGEGIRAARRLVNNSHYRLGLLYARIGNFHLAAKCIKTHIANRNRNCISGYKLRDVRKDLALILEGKDPRNLSP